MLVNIDTEESMRQLIYTKPSLTGTDGIRYSCKMHYRKIQVAPIIIFLPQIMKSNIEPSKRTTIDDLINKYTTSAHGKEAWKVANKKIDEELYQDMISGKLNKVKYYRMIHNMDQKMLAQFSGIKQPNISRIERDGYPADTSTYKKIAAVFNIDYKELMP